MNRNFKNKLLRLTSIDRKHLKILQSLHKRLIGIIVRIQHDSRRRHILQISTKNRLPINPISRLRIPTIKQLLNKRLTIRTLNTRHRLRLLIRNLVVRRITLKTSQHSMILKHHNRVVNPRNLKIIGRQPRLQQRPQITLTTRKIVNVIIRHTLNSEEPCDSATRVKILHINLRHINDTSSPKELRNDGL